MALKGIEQTTQMSSYHSLPPPQGHHSHRGCVGNLFRGGGPSSPKPPHSHPAGWSLSCTSSVKPVSRFPPSLLLLSPYCMCILYSTSSRSIFPQTPKPSIVWGCEIHGQWPNHSLWPQPLPALTATWLSMPHRDGFPWGFCKQWLFFSLTVLEPLIWRLLTHTYHCTAVFLIYSFHILGELVSHVG